MNKEVSVASARVNVIQIQGESGSSFALKTDPLLPTSTSAEGLKISGQWTNELSNAGFRQLKTTDNAEITPIRKLHIKESTPKSSH